MAREASTRVPARDAVAVLDVNGCRGLHGREALRTIAATVHARPHLCAAWDDGAPFAFAGLWDRWKDPVSGGPLETYTIIGK